MKEPLHFFFEGLLRERIKTWKHTKAKFLKGIKGTTRLLNRLTYFMARSLYAIHETSPHSAILATYPIFMSSFSAKRVKCVGCDVIELTSTSTSLDGSTPVDVTSGQSVRLMSEYSYLFREIGLKLSLIRKQHVT